MNTSDDSSTYTGTPIPKTARLSHCNNCPLTPTLVAVLALMGHDWLGKELFRMQQTLMEEDDLPETAKEAYSLIAALKERLESEMKRLDILQLKGRGK